MNNINDYHWCTPLSVVAGKRNKPSTLCPDEIYRKSQIISCKSFMTCIFNN